MIARLWHGYTAPAHADAYEAMLKPERRQGFALRSGRLRRRTRTSGGLTVRSSQFMDPATSSFLDQVPLFGALSADRPSPRIPNWRRR